MKNNAFKNNNSKSKTPKFHQVEIRNNRKVKNFRKTEILDSKEKLELEIDSDSQTNDTDKKRFEVLILKSLEHIEGMMVDLTKDKVDTKIAILDGQISTITSEIASLKKDIYMIRTNLLQNISQIQSLAQEIEEIQESNQSDDALEGKIQFLFKQSQSQAQDVEKIKSCMEVFSSHIGVLEKKSEKWTDKFKFGRKPKSIAEEQVFKQHIMEINNSKVHFALNDD